jgi:hypothetical protein
LLLAFPPDGERHGAPPKQNGFAGYWIGLGFSRTAASLTAREAEFSHRDKLRSRSHLPSDGQVGDPIPSGIVGRAQRVVNLPHDPVIVIPVYEDVDLLDVTGPFEMFRWANIEVRLVAQTRTLSRGSVKL